MKKLLTMLVACTMLASLSGCAAISHRNLDVQAKMSSTVFLDSETLAEMKPVYVRVTNTSDKQEIDFGNLLRQKLAAKGRTITMNPKEASHQIQANLLYIGAEKNDMTTEGALMGGYGGAIAGALAARNSGLGTQLLTGGATGLAAAGVGALAGSMVHVDTWMGLCDIQIKEAVAGGVTGTMTSSHEQGSGTTLRTERKVSSNSQEYRTRIAVKATQTNINEKEATGSIADKLATQIAAMFGQ